MIVMKKQEAFIMGLITVISRGEKNMRPEGCKMNQMTVTVETSSKNITALKTGWKSDVGSEQTATSDK